MLNSKTLHDIPAEALLEITNQLSDIDRDSIKKISRYFHAFIHEFYLGTLYGRFNAFNRFFEKEIKNLEEAIDVYKNSQTVTVRNLQRAEPQDRFIFLEETFLITFCFCSGLAVDLFFSTNRSKVTNFVEAIFLLLVILYPVLKRANTNLNNRILDADARTHLNELFESKKLIPTCHATFFNNQQLTQQQTKLKLDDILKSMKQAVHTLRETQLTLLGRNVDSVDLSEIQTTDEKNMLKYYLAEWNVKSEDQAKRIEFKK